MTAIIDGDILIYRMCWTISPDAPLYAVKNHCNTYMRNLLDKVGCSDYIAILGIHGSDNVKYEMFPEYKKGRPSDKPPHWNRVMNYLISEWGFICISGCEVDDAIRHCAEFIDDCIIVSSDKDLLQIPGNHFVMGITRKGKVIKEDKLVTITKEEGERNFYRQMLTGDMVDNVRGIKGIGPRKASKLIPFDCDINTASLTVRDEYQKAYKEDYATKFIMNILLLKVNGEYARGVGFERPIPVPYKSLTKLEQGY